MAAGATPAQLTGELPAPAVGTQRGPVVELFSKPAPIPKVAEPRSWELFRHRCGSSLGSRELTLFLDGTLRLRVRDKEGEEIRLGQLDPARLSRTYGGLRTIEERIGREAKEWSKGGPAHGFSGEFLQECEVELRLPDREREIFEFSPLEIPPLWLGQLRQLAEDLAGATELLQNRGLPRDYEPRNGDLLRRRDGVVFRYVGTTSDGKAWILEQVGQPLTTYYPVAERDQIFVGLVASRTGSLPPPVQ